jgi:hypothetical protein
VLSIAVMQATDWLASIFNWRAKDLERTIRDLLGGDKSLSDQIYNHPLVASLYRGRQTRRKPRLPSYIPADKFALSLLDLAMTAGTEASPLRTIFKDVHAQLDQLQEPGKQKMAQEDWVTILQSARQIASSGLGRHAVDSLKLQVQTYGEKYPELQDVIDLALPQLDAYYQTLLADQRSAEMSGQTDLSLRQVRLGVLALQHASPELKTSLTTLLANAEASTQKGEQAVAAARAAIEVWFNNAMDRLSGAYKRKAQLVTFVIGVILALTLNVDTIQVATSLWREPTLRQAIIAQAEQYSLAAAEPASSEGEARAIGATVTDLQEELNALSFPFGWHTAPFDAGDRQCAYLPFDSSQVMGFPSRDENGLPVCKRISNFPVDLPGWLGKVLGLLISGAAAAQGAPFWFDILRKMVSAREMLKTEKKA